MKWRWRAATAFVVSHVVLTWLAALRRGAARRRLGSPAAALTGTSPGPGAWPPVSILVPAWRERATIARCIRSLQELEYPSWEAVVVAGGPDGTLEVARAAVAGDRRLRVLPQAPLGKNAALALGVQAALHDVLVLLDADSEVTPEWLSAIVRPLTDGATVSFGDYRPTRATWITRVEQMERIQAYEISGSTSLQGSGAVALRRATLEHAGGLPQDVRVGVDWDLGVRLAAAGERIVFAPAACLRTERPATMREFWQNEVRWRRAHLRGLWRHRETQLNRPSAVARASYFYALCLAAAGAAVTGAGVGLVVPAQRGAVAGAAVLATGWLLGRRAALGGEVWAYSGDATWLAMAWAPAALLLPTMVSGVVACLTAARPQVWFQGPREPGWHSRETEQMERPDGP